MDNPQRSILGDEDKRSTTNESFLTDVKTEGKKPVMIDKSNFIYYREESFMSHAIDLTNYHEKIKTMFCYEGKTDKEIAENIGICSPACIFRYRKKHKIVKLFKDEEWIKEQREKGLSDVQIGAIINCSPSTIGRRCPHPESKGKNYYTINNNLFSGYSKEEVYWAGFIMADGHLENYAGYGRNKPNYKLSFGLSQKDEEHLKKFAIFLGDENIHIKNSETKLDGYEKIHIMSTLKISRKQVVLNLVEKYKIPFNKSTNEFIPKEIPEEMIPHFIRGYFDGDGSIYKGRQARIDIVGGYNICKEIQDYFKFGYFSKDQVSEKLYHFRVYKKAEVKKFRDTIYKDSNSLIRLDRKFDVFRLHESLKD